ncbi:MAG: nucleotidyltransferase domain-containing protein [Bacteroidales bacterium]|nr:nucleotidyltransferase domain-containing protein [Bacteroidales bacterium]MCD8393802.1 nucleotidyltransferase domain-containing protein [Bacteroidales bacterium]
MNPAITNTLCKFFKRQPIEKAWVFGSFARGEERGDSDIDILVSFDKNAQVSLLQHAAMYLELKRLLGREVDLVTEGTLLKFAMPSVAKDRILIYEREA